MLAWWVARSTLGTTDLPRNTFFSAASLHALLLDLVSLLLARVRLTRENVADDCVTFIAILLLSYVSNNTLIELKCKETCDKFRVSPIYTRVVRFPINALTPQPWEVDCSHARQCPTPLKLQLWCCSNITQCNKFKWIFKNN